MPKHELTWKEAIIKVLQGATEPLHPGEITARIKKNGLRESTGAIPEKTVHAQIWTSLKQGTASPFEKIGKNTYILKSDVNAIKPPLTTTPELGNDDAYPEPPPDIITSFGMYWRRDVVAWKTKTQLLGKQADADTPVDFSGQKGIYFLYDGRELIYVGRASEQPFGKRLFQHTTDRLTTRWNRFSWFGLRPVSEEGKLEEMPDIYNAELLIPVLEALLIEATEPRQNRKAGDDWTDKEYMQVPDLTIQKAKLQALIDKL